MKRTISIIEIISDDSISYVRQRARAIAADLELDVHAQTRIAAAASEAARDVWLANGGRIEFFLECAAVCNLCFSVTLQDQNSFATFLANPALNESFGSGFIQAKGLMETYEIRAADPPAMIFGISLGRRLTDESLLRLRFITDPIGGERKNEAHAGALRELHAAMHLLRQKEDEIARMTLELDETNRGVVALYAELDEKAESLKRADEIKSKFLSYMSHEFRTPLHSIIGLTRLLSEDQEKNLMAEQHKQLGYILKAAEDMADLVNDLLDLSKIEAGKTEVQPRVFQVADLFGALRGMFRPIASNPNVSLTFDDSAGSATVYTDEPKVSQILRNYISNALKFTEKGEVRVWAEVDKTQNMIRFGVSDTGIGIPQDRQSLLFREYSQVNSPLQLNTKGTGLGLALCRKLAELLNGSVGVTSSEGEGSTFYLSLPKYLEDADFANQKIIEIIQGKTILLIDDDPKYRSMLKSWFEEVGCRVQEAGNGNEGLQICMENCPDLIILDLQMPVMNGAEFVKVISAIDNLQKVPVVVSSSAGLDKEEIREVEPYVHHIFAKHDFTRERALPVISTLLAGQST